MSSKQSQDPRAIRSRRWLQEALLALIEEMPYQAITVTDITERAEISRPTFYLHYGSKDELLLSCLDNMFDQFYEEIDGYLEGIAIEESVGIKIFEQMEEQVDLIRLILDAGAIGLLRERFQQYILQVFELFLQKNRREGVETAVLEFTTDYLAGASLGLIVRWMEQGMVYSPTVMGRVYYELIQPGLTNVLVRGVLDGKLMIEE